MAVALLALVIAVVGGGTAAVAGGAYLITSSKQIKPGAVKAKNLSKKTLDELRGQTGPAGAPGPAGAAGARGPRGPSDAWLIRSTGEPDGVTVPPGSYIASGAIYVGSSSSASCILWRRTVGSSLANGAGSYTTQNGQVTLPVGTAFVLTQPTIVYVDCTGTGAVSSAVSPLVSVLSVDNLVLGPT